MYLRRVVLLVSCLGIISGCLEVYITSNDGGVVLGRTMEFAMDTEIITEPVGQSGRDYKASNCGSELSFVNKYAVIKLQARLKGRLTAGALDGINDKGLSIAMLYLPSFASYTPESDIKGDKCSSAVSQLMLTDYILASYESVTELKADIENDRFPIVWGLKKFGRVQPVHYAVTDKSGDAIVLQYISDRGRLVFNNTVGVVTNSPPYDWHMNNLRNYPHLTNIDRKGFSYWYRGEEITLASPGSGSGLLGMPGDYSSPSRFVKAAALRKLVDKPDTKDQAIVQIIHLLNAADIVKGVGQPFISLSGKPEDSDRSQFTDYAIIKDLTDGCLLYRDYIGVSLKRICFKDIPKHKAFIKLHGRFEDSFKDIADKLLKTQDFRSNTRAEL